MVAQQFGDGGESDMLLKISDQELWRWMLWMIESGFVDEVVGSGSNGRWGGFVDC